VDYISAVVGFVISIALSGGVMYALTRGKKIELGHALLKMLISGLLIVAFAGLMILIGSGYWDSQPSCFYAMRQSEAYLEGRYNVSPGKKEITCTKISCVDIQTSSVCFKIEYTYGINSGILAANCKSEESKIKCIFHELDISQGMQETGQ
jgi:hypothetical protein